MIKTKAELLAAVPLKTDTVRIGESDVEVTELTAQQRDQINQLLAADEKNIFEINARIAIMGCDFLEDDDLEDLMAGSLETFMPLVDRITMLSGMDDEEGVAEAKKS